MRYPTSPHKPMAERVAAGIEYLDRTEGRNWRQKIHAPFSMQEPEYCIIGQLDGDGRVLSYDRAIEARFDPDSGAPGTSNYPERARELGFDISYYNNESYRDLTAEWIKQADLVLE